MTLKMIFINVLTLIRIIGTFILIPVYDSFGAFTASVLSMICYLTDSVDGLLARKWNVSTFFGALFDGVADKLFTIINFIVLYLITHYAIIPILLELSIVFVLFIKFVLKQNIQSNIIGKCKVWILAMCVVLALFISGISDINFIPLIIKEYFLNIPSNNLYFYILLPAIIMEALTLLSYILEIFKPKKIKILNKTKKELKINKLEGKNRWENFKNIWLNPDFYNEHKNDANLIDLWKLSNR